MAGLADSATTRSRGAESVGGVRATRFVPLSGVAAVILIVVGSAAAGNTPKPDAPVAKLVSFYTAHDRGQVTSGVLLALGAIFFLVFSAAVVEAFRTAEVDAHVASTLAFSGALVFAAGLSIAAGLAVFIGDVASHAQPSALEALHVASLTVIFPWAVGACAFLLGVGAATLQTRLFPSWLGWAAIALAAIAAVPSHVLGGLLDHVGVIPIAVLGIWMLIVSVLLFRSASTARA